MAGWLEAYAESLELNIWVSSTVQKADWNETSKTWSAIVSRGGDTRNLNPKYLVFANGFGGGKPYMPEIPDKVCRRSTSFRTSSLFTYSQVSYKGTILHSVDYRSAKGFEGKKAIVVGACNSGSHFCPHRLSYCRTD